MNTDKLLWATVVVSILGMIFQFKAIYILSKNEIIYLEKPKIDFYRINVNDSNGKLDKILEEIDRVYKKNMIAEIQRNKATSFLILSLFCQLLIAFFNVLMHFSVK